ncbi:MAG: ribonuclease HII [Alphaproteobacteria bacterium CG_4_9_14_3_um_filter_47_13]|nr:MAG: ribonuclease HII [Alphaproteobacteria bacterium CG_4_9_14_3_um_filter_47_13]
MTNTAQFPDFTIENQYDGLVCGIDEAGRGPLAGCVVAACVYIPDDIRQHTFIQSINDSKKLTRKNRETLFVQIMEHCLFGIAQVTPEEIDSLNIHHASLLAMKRAHGIMQDNFKIEPEVALIDGKFSPALPCSPKPVIKGDRLSLSIAAASILAKVTRDRIMTELHLDYPVYGWERNAGYGTKEHLRAIADHGITAHHRRSYAPVKSAIYSSY